MREQIIGRAIPTVPVASHRARSLTRYCQDLRHLIYWMENDRSLDARPEKIQELRRMLVDLERQLLHLPIGRKIDPAAGSLAH